mmetsp:Transcript_24605/g.58383  ORF Transcript_24605/g.58383 Transcript_24605/m.58383 type:complete len:600 (+) Transcript_24605:4036-5835(+)
MQRHAALDVARVHVGLGVQQQPLRVEGGLAGRGGVHCEVQRRAALGVQRGGGRAPLQQLLDDLEVPCRSRDVQGRSAFRAAGLVDGGICRQQRGHNLAGLGLTRRCRRDRVEQRRGLVGCLVSNVQRSLTLQEQVHHEVVEVLHSVMNRLAPIGGVHGGGIGPDLEQGAHHARLVSGRSLLQGPRIGDLHGLNLRVVHELVARHQQLGILDDLEVPASHGEESGVCILGQCFHRATEHRHYCCPIHCIIFNSGDLPRAGRHFAQSRLNVVLFDLQATQELQSHWSRHANMVPRLPERILLCNVILGQRLWRHCQPQLATHHLSCFDLHADICPRLRQLAHHRHAALFHRGVQRQPGEGFLLRVEAGSEVVWAFLGICKIHVGAGREQGGDNPQASFGSRQVQSCPPRNGVGDIEVGLSSNVSHRENVLGLHRHVQGNGAFGMASHGGSLRIQQRAHEARGAQRLRQSLRERAEGKAPGLVCGLGLGETHRAGALAGEHWRNAGRLTWDRCWLTPHMIDHQLSSTRLAVDGNAYGGIVFPGPCVRNPCQRRLLRSPHSNPHLAILDVHMLQLEVPLALCQSALRTGIDTLPIWIVVAKLS